MLQETVLPQDFLYPANLPVFEPYLNAMGVGR